MDSAQIQLLSFQRRDNTLTQDKHLPHRFLHFHLVYQPIYYHQKAGIPSHYQMRNQLE